MKKQQLVHLVCSVSLGITDIFTCVIINKLTADVFTFTKRLKKCKVLFSVWRLFQPWSVRRVCAGTCCPDLSTVNQHVLWLTGRTGRVKATFTESLNTQRPCITKTIKIKKAKRQKGKKAGTNNCCGPRAGSCTAELLIVIFVPNSTTVTQFGNSRHRTISKTQIKTTMNKQTPKAKEANNKQAQCNTKKTAKRIKLNFWDAKRNYGNKQRYRGQKET